MGALILPFFAIMKAKQALLSRSDEKAPLPFASFRKFCEDSKSGFSPA
jgi:hypothetical protein